MGVIGLTTFIAKDANRYLKPTVLKDCHLVIDGNCIASHLYKWRTKRDSAFGGDYDEYANIVRSFFNQLKRHRITPIVVMDGGYEERKFTTVILRVRQKIATLQRTFNKGFSDVKFFPLFMLQVFYETVESLKIQLIQCEFEADGEIATLARALNCPVLSYDSDFYIYNVLYVPFSTFEWESTSEGDEGGLACSLYDLTDFLKIFPGLCKHHLPLVAVLMGNDFNEAFADKNMFEKSYQSSKKKQPSDTRVSKILKWLSCKTEESAITKVKEFLDVNDARLFDEAMAKTRANYSFIGGSKATVCDNGSVIVKPPCFQTLFHPRIQSLLTCAKLPPFLITMAVLRRFIPPLLVESVESNSAHSTSLMMVNTIDGLLCSSMNINQDESSLGFFIRHRSIIKESIGKRHLMKEHEKYHILIDEPVEVRKDFVMSALNLEDIDKQCMFKIIPECQFFMATYINWCLSTGLSGFHKHALLLCYLSLQAKNRVGYFRIGKDCKIPAEEITAFTSIFASYKKTTNAAKTCYSSIAVHEFSSFQSMLYYASTLNAMLENPFKPCKITETFNGTLVYNLYVQPHRLEVFKRLQDFLKTAPHFKSVYSDLIEILSRYLPSMDDFAHATEKKKKKKKKKKSKTLKEEPEEKEEANDDVDDDFHDLSNKFSCLRTDDM